MSRTLCLLVAAIILSSTPSRGAEPILLGMLEQHAQCRETPAPAVRALFARDGNGWVSLAGEAPPTFDLTDLHWTIAFDGQSLGVVRTSDPGSDNGMLWARDRDYRLSVPEDQALPAIANLREEFGGWCHLPEVRPLVVNLRPLYQDPDQWRPFVVGAGYRDLLFEAFKQALGEPLRCLDLPRDQVLGAGDLMVHKAYRDVAGRQLVALRLMPDGEKCIDQRGLKSPVVWFAIADDVRYIGSDLEFIDAGDYDADGESEIMFWYSAYSEDGYSLLFDGLSRRADYHWKYH